MLARWMKSRVLRMAASAAAVVGLGVAAFWIGGQVMAGAAIVTGVYVGTLFTAARFRKPVDPSSSRLTKAVLVPLKKGADWLFRHRLLTTIILGVTASWMVGITTVTGIAAGAFSALAGDMIVELIADASDAMIEGRLESADYEYQAV
jgi:hypothetical protein